MESSSSSSLAPVFSSQSWKYDVFLSFRGEDTRETFVDHLYSSLAQKGINTYKDDERLGLGDLIVPSLTKAIENSQIAIIVFSEGYADSAWCLNELAHIMKCHETRGQLVMPIFYNVDPSQMRKQKRKYGVTFSKDDDSKNKDKVESWRRALVNACNLSGWVPKSGHESQVIEEIVEKVSLRLQPETSSVTEKLVGMADRVQALMAALQIGSGGVRMIGVCGLGGGGKTTLASCVYNEIYSKFDGCCFVRNIREESRRRGLEELKKEIISKVEAQSGGGGRRLINKMFCYMKVMFVLDDVDQLDQLKALAGSPDWFGEGSRIIITSRDRHLLEAHKVLVHDLSLLNKDEAAGLFRKHAHLEDYKQIEDYESLSKELVSYAGGLPLALRVLGSFLCDNSIQQWKGALARLKQISDAHILEMLKVSYDGLRDDLKGLFLDIACFFRWSKKDRAMEVLDACGFDPVTGVEELRQKALITIDSYGCFDMHDLVQEMAHYIVRGEHPNNPAKSTRVWKKEDILRVCAMDASKELDNIKAIQVEAFFFQEKDPPPIVANMENLRYLSWRGDPTNPSLDNFPPRELRCLILHGGSQEQLWNRYKYLPNLKMMELKHLEKLIMTPDFNGLPSLERFRVYECPNLKEIHSSLGRLKRLVCLCIEDCPRIEMAPSITRLTKLETLSIKGYPKPFELSDIQEKMDNLRVLDLSRCRFGDEDMSSAVWQLRNLQELNLSENKFSRLDFSLLKLPWLKRLNLSGCNRLVELSHLPSSIAVVIADGCTSLESLGDISNCKWLWRVSFRGVYKVGPINGHMLLHSMLKGNAFEDHHISLSLQHQIPKGFVGRLFRSSTFIMRLPHDCYSDYCGFLIHVASDNMHPNIDITIKEEEVGEDPSFEARQESSFEALETEYDGPTYVGYVSFSWLRRTACFNSTYNAISFNLRKKLLYSAADRLGAALVPRRRKDDPVQATDCSEFWDEEGYYSKAFTIQHASDSSINILWQP